MRWTAVLCLGIVLLAAAFVAAVLFLAISPAPPAAGGKSIVSKAKILPKSIGAIQAPPGMQPTEPNMTILAQTKGNFMYSGTNTEVDVTNPPLLIDLSVVPKIVTDTKWFTNRSLTKKEEIVQVAVASSSAFVNLSVIEQETGRIVAQEGFGIDNSIDKDRSVKVYKPGKYLVKLYGNEVAVQALISMRTPGLTF